MIVSSVPKIRGITNISWSPVGMANTTSKHNVPKIFFMIVRAQNLQLLNQNKLAVYGWL